VEEGKIVFPVVRMGMAYTYNVKTDNRNGQTIRGPSTNESKFRSFGSNAFYPDVQKFVDYYGVPNYADVWVMAALEGAKVNFSHGEIDFSRLRMDPIACKRKLLYQQCFEIAL